MNSSSLGCLYKLVIIYFPIYMLGLKFTNYKMHITKPVGSHSHMRDTSFDVAKLPNRVWEA